MKNRLYCKILAVGIIILFLGVIVSSAISVGTKPNVLQYESDECSDCEKTESGICENIEWIYDRLNQISDFFEIYMNEFPNKPIILIIFGAFLMTFLRLSDYVWVIGHFFDCDWAEVP